MRNKEESASGEKLEEVGESKESDELDTINEPESQVEELSQIHKIFQTNQQSLPRK